MTVSVIAQYPVWTEACVQNAVYIYCAGKSHEIVVPNSGLFAWEADVISVTRAGIIHEFEIKLSRADFRADAKKDKAKWLLDPVVPFQPWFPEIGLTETKTLKRPNYFHYVVPKGLIEAGEVPEHAGLFYMDRPIHGLLWQQKEPRKLHNEKIDDKQYRQLERSLVHRYWKQRLNGKLL